MALRKICIASQKQGWWKQMKTKTGIKKTVFILASENHSQILRGYSCCQTFSSGRNRWKWIHSLDGALSCLCSCPSREYSTQPKMIRRHIFWFFVSKCIASSYKRVTNFHIFFLYTPLPSIGLLIIITHGQVHQGCYCNSVHLEINSPWINRVLLELERMNKGLSHEQRVKGT